MSLKIKVKVKPNSKNQLIEEKEDELGEHYLLVSVKSPPQEGKANAEVIELLAKHFGVKKSQIKIKLGSSSKFKLVEVCDSITVVALKSLRITFSLKMQHTWTS
jgi:uncharacterized protein